VADNAAPKSKFSHLLAKLVRVPKAEIDAEERKHQKRKRKEQPAKAREIVPRQTN
jgi:hypothetical protein